MTDDGKDYEYEWDPLGRLRKVRLEAMCWSPSSPTTARAG